MQNIIKQTQFAGGAFDVAAKYSPRCRDHISCVLNHDIFSICSHRMMALSIEAGEN